MLRGSKYDPLRDYLATRRGAEVVLSLEEIEEILGFVLHEGAAKPNWWANTRSLIGRTQRKAWANADYDAFFLAKERAVRFQPRHQAIGPREMGSEQT